MKKLLLASAITFAASPAFAVHNGVHSESAIYDIASNDAVTINVDEVCGVDITRTGEIGKEGNEGTSLQFNAMSNTGGYKLSVNVDTSAFMNAANETIDGDWVNVKVQGNTWQGSWEFTAAEGQQEREFVNRDGEYLDKVQNVFVYLNDDIADAYLRAGENISVPVELSVTCL